VFIDDMVQALLLAAIKPDATGDVFVVAGEQAVTTRELVETFCMAFDLPQPFVRLPHAIGETMAICAESCFGLIGREPPLSRRTLEFFNTSNAFDISRARRFLGFAPRFHLVAGLAATRQRMNGRA
jgi:nucleoside-diphosphate-sugar epimerase